MITKYSVWGLAQGVIAFLQMFCRRSLKNMSSFCWFEWLLLFYFTFEFLFILRYLFGFVCFVVSPKSRLCFELIHFF